MFSAESMSDQRKTESRRAEVDSILISGYRDPAWVGCRTRSVDARAPSLVRASSHALSYENSGRESLKEVRNYGPCIIGLMNIPTQILQMMSTRDGVLTQRISKNTQCLLVFLAPFDFLVCLLLLRRSFRVSFHPTSQNSPWTFRIVELAPTGYPGC